MRKTEVKSGTAGLTIAIACLMPPAVAKPAPEPLPSWVTAKIENLRASQSRDVIEEEAYDGKRTFEWISGYSFDTGDEHVLFAEDGRLICKFGGFVGHVTSGSCEPRKIVYVRTLYPGSR
jgi:hypothetical protein